MAASGSERGEKERVRDRGMGVDNGSRGEGIEERTSREGVCKGQGRMGYRDVGVNGGVPNGGVSVRNVVNSVSFTNHEWRE